MTASSLGIAIIVIVVVAGLVVWLTAVFHAERHPDPGRGGAPARKVTGGMFCGDPRQQTPRRDAAAEVMTPETGAGWRGEETDAGHDDG
jgi:hypothetical protein